MSAFFAMGGYAAFVWPAYGATLAGFALAGLLSWRGYARARARLARLEGANEKTGP